MVAVRIVDQPGTGLGLVTEVARREGDVVATIHGAEHRCREAEAAMDRAESRGKAFGSYDPTALNYRISQVRYELGDVPGAISAMQESDPGPPPRHAG
ncbi:hypothetical protein [Streptomyces roseochromogenus]|uniref:Uncharacterized protein n=1 Tax=Streptomyces roseochromogenus subsp. oscitans DS 12.976 TaxID=1352936 RepID=V6K592_STRRC|nr:hypothetical protein M878_25165 [Streptomyces roseochromogenus subsp. oscitans DS 12.976]